MAFAHSRGQSPSQAPPSSSKYHHPYFTSSEVEYLSEKQRGKLSATQEEKIRQNACGLLDALGARIGFPRRTTATAQNLYHRFHLFFPRKDFNYYDVSLAALLVSTKMHDTLKKPRELLAVSYAIRFPDLAAKSKHPTGEVDLDTMDPQVVEHDLSRLLAVERLILETICFNFTSRMPFPYVIKIGRALNATKKLTQLAWRLAIDSYRTLLPVQYPPQTIALGSLYVAALLSSFEQPASPSREGFRSSQELAAYLGKHGSWEKKFKSQVEDLEDIAHTVIDLILQGVQNPSANTSPSTPSSPAPHLSSRHQHPSQSHVQPPPYNADQLIRLKIDMRRNEHPPRPRQPLGSADPSALYRGDDLGRNEGTVRFLFGPPSVAESL
ncbi:CTD kinase subunit beta [Hypsizygus marmoreus]|uniref:CTD kinase subunit beta n=1 Tax=Hypsizygus marmoreus TaxID=39966 RepID=A0A369JBQ6_HYPMA|nr:CTD kinase subunit beta [Hypsizygus marmoreus]